MSSSATAPQRQKEGWLSKTDRDNPMFIKQNLRENRGVGRNVHVLNYPFPESDWSHTGF